jgi:hypothetical protein
MSSVVSVRDVALEAIQAIDAELNRLRDGRTLVRAAVEYKEVGLMRDLLRASADGNVPNRGGLCPIQIAAVYGLLDMVRCLINDAGVSVHAGEVDARAVKHPMPLQLQSRRFVAQTRRPTRRR